MFPKTKASPKLSSGYRPTTKRVFISWTRLRLLSNKYIYVVNGHCIPCGGANLQQGPTTVKHDTGAPVQSPASSPHTTPTPNQGAPSRHCVSTPIFLEISKKSTQFPSQLGDTCWGRLWLSLNTSAGKFLPKNSMGTNPIQR